MMHIGVGIMYMMIGVTWVKIIPNLNPDVNSTSVKIGKTMLLAGIIITAASLVTLIPFVPSITSSIILSFVVVFESLYVVRKAKREVEKSRYGESYLLAAVLHEDKKEFDEGYYRYPTILSYTPYPSIFKGLAEKGLLEDWVGDKKAGFRREVYEEYKKHRLTSLYRKDWDRHSD